MMTTQAEQLQARLKELKQKQAKVKARIRKINTKTRQTELKQRNSRLIRISEELFTTLGRDPEEADIVRMKRFAEQYKSDLKYQFNADMQPHQPSHPRRRPGNRKNSRHVKNQQ